MAGIWDRIVPTSSDRLAIHLLTAAVYLGAEGVFTDVQILTGLNSTLTTPLDAAATADLVNIRTQALAGASAARARYPHLLESLAIAVETGLLTNEATFRSRLNIP
jgi:hypothetical protein